MTEEEIKQTAESPLTRVSGTVEVEVDKIDGKKETVTVRTASLSKMRNMLLCIDDDASFIAFCTGKPVEWVDGLTLESQDELHEMGLELNRPILAAYLRRKKKLGEMAANLGVPIPGISLSQ